MKQKKYRPKRRPRLEINVQQLDQIVDKAYDAPLSIEDGELLKTSIHAMAARLTSQSRTTEKAKDLLGGNEGESQSDGNEGASAPLPQPDKKALPGHGRNGAAAFTGATNIPVPHPDLAPKCTCPGCCKGKLYEIKPRLQNPAENRTNFGPGSC